MGGVSAVCSRHATRGQAVFDFVLILELKNALGSRSGQGVQQIDGDYG